MTLNLFSGCCCNPAGPWCLSSLVEFCADNHPTAASFAFLLEDGLCDCTPAVGGNDGMDQLMFDEVTRSSRTSSRMVRAWLGIRGPSYLLWCRVAAFARVWRARQSDRANPASKRTLLCKAESNTRAKVRLRDLCGIYRYFLWRFHSAFDPGKRTRIIGKPGLGVFLVIRFRIYAISSLRLRCVLGIR